MGVYYNQYKNIRAAAVLVDLWVSECVYEVCGKILFYFSTDAVLTYPHIHKHIPYGYLGGSEDWINLGACGPWVR